jgi:uncharacterized protein with von Willebrand factor type A (vWA) domain
MTIIEAPENMPSSIVEHGEIIQDKYYIPYMEYRFMKQNGYNTTGSIVNLWENVGSLTIESQKHVIEHELGHRVNIPKTIIDMVIHREIIKSCHLPEKFHQEYLNIIYDLIVDHDAMNGKYGQMYEKGFLDMAGKQIQYQDVLPEQETLGQFFLNMYTIILDVKHGKIPRMNDLEQKAYDLMFDDKRGFNVRFKELTELLWITVRNSEIEQENTTQMIMMVTAPPQNGQQGQSGQNGQQSDQNGNQQNQSGQNEQNGQDGQQSDQNGNQQNQSDQGGQSGQSEQSEQNGQSGQQSNQNDNQQNQSGQDGQQSEQSSQSSGGTGNGNGNEDDPSQHTSNNPGCGTGANQNEQMPGRSMIQIASYEDLDEDGQKTVAQELIQLCQMTGDSINVHGNNPDLKKRMRRTRALRMALPEIKAKSASAKTFRKQNVGKWYAGQHTEELDVIKTLQTSGIMIPNLTTERTKPVPDKIGITPSKIPHIIIVSDISGSMQSNDNIEHLVDANIALVRVAKEKKYPVSLITFNNSTKIHYDNTRDYDKVENVILQLQSSGGTDIGRAVKAIDKLQKLKNAAVFIFTDEHNQSISRDTNTETIRKIKNNGNVFLYCIGSDLSEEQKRNLRGSVTEAYSIDTGKKYATRVITNSIAL